jgi:tetratricopeptide (TPR) repeat protein
LNPLETARRLFLEALALQEQSRFQEAARLYEQALVLAPRRPSVMNNLTSVYIQIGKFEAAKQLCEQCLKLDPQDDSARIHLGVCQLNLQSVELGLQTLEEVLARRPNEVYAQINRAIGLQRLERFPEALDAIECALAIQPGFPQALNTRGNVLLKLGRSEDAIASYEQALLAQPDHDESLFNLAATLLRAGRDNEADAVFRRAIEQRPGDVRRRINYADALRSLYRSDEAAAQYQTALALDPNAADAHYGLGANLLMQQNYERGWPHYEWRLRSDEFRQLSFRPRADSVAKFDRQIRWDGSVPSDGGKVAIWSEQGVGDEVLFSTLIPELAATGVALVYEIDGRLLGLYRRAFPSMQFVARRDPPVPELLAAEFALAAGSLPSLWRTTAAQFVRQPRSLFKARHDRVAYYRGALNAAGEGLKIALSWHSARDHWLVRKKNATLAQLAVLLKVPRVQFVDVQYGDTAKERREAEAATGIAIHRFDKVDHFNDLEELCAILAACDLVITTSNATAHLAGALGKRTWVLFPAGRAPFHYWAHDGDARCLWYPSVEIVAAPEYADWSTLSEHVAQKLARYIALRQSSVGR